MIKYEPDTLSHLFYSVVLYISSYFIDASVSSHCIRFDMTYRIRHVYRRLRNRVKNLFAKAKRYFRCNDMLSDKSSFGSRIRNFTLRPAKGGEDTATDMPHGKADNFSMHQPIPRRGRTRFFLRDWHCLSCWSRHSQLTANKIEFAGYLEASIGSDDEPRHECWAWCRARPKLCTENNSTQKRTFYFRPYTEISC